MRCWMKLVSWVGVIATFVITMEVSNVVADIYKYTDKSGVVNMTNDINAVPKRYRSSMKVIKEEAKPQQHTTVLMEGNTQLNYSSGEQPANESDAAVEEPSSYIGILFSKFGWLKPLVIILCMMGSFAVIGKIASMVSSPQLSKIIYTAYFLGIFVFMYTMYAKHVVNSYFTVKDKAVEMLKKSNVREPLPPTGEGQDANALSAK